MYIVTTYFAYNIYATKFVVNLLTDFSEIEVTEYDQAKLDF